MATKKAKPLSNDNKTQTKANQEIETLPGLSYLEEEITLTHMRPFRRQGLTCSGCGSKREMLWIEGKAVYLICYTCGKQKGKEPFIERKLIEE